MKGLDFIPQRLVSSSMFALCNSSQSFSVKPAEAYAALLDPALLRHLPRAINAKKKETNRINIQQCLCVPGTCVN